MGHVQGQERFLEAWTSEGSSLWLLARTVAWPSSRWKGPWQPLQLPFLSSCREKDSLAHSLQAAKQQAEELRQEWEKLQAAQEELRRQRDQLEEEREDTVQDHTRTRRELARRRVASGSLPGPLGWAPGPWLSLGAREH